jgi:ribosomal protein L7/L12
MIFKIFNRQITITIEKSARKLLTDNEVLKYANKIKNWKPEYYQMGQFNKIAMIKKLRDRYHIGLKSAADVVKVYCEINGIDISY